MVLTIDRTFEKALHDKDSQKYMTFERDVIEVVRILCIPICLCTTDSRERLLKLLLKSLSSC